MSPSPPTDKYPPDLRISRRPTLIGRLRVATPGCFGTARGAARGGSETPFIESYFPEPLNLLDWMKLDKIR